MKKLLTIALVLMLTSISAVSAEEHGMMNNTGTTGVPTQDNTPNGTDTLPVYNTGTSTTAKDTKSLKNKKQIERKEYWYPGESKGKGIEKENIRRTAVRGDMRQKREEVRNERENKREEVRNERELERGNKREEMKNEREKRKNEIRDKREEMGKNREEMKNINGLKSDFKKLDKNTKNDLKDTYNIYREEMKNLKKEYKDSLNNENKRVEIKNKMEQARQDNYTKVKTIVGNNPTFLNKIKQKETIFKKNLKLRKDNRIARKALRGDRAIFIAKYKKAFNNRLKNIIDRIPDSKLQIVAKKIDAAITKIENTKKLSDRKRNNIMDQVLALKEIIDERIATSAATNDVIDIKSLLTF